MAFEGEARDRRYIQRWSIARVIKTQSNAEHHYYVTLYADQIATLIGWKGSRSLLLQYCLRHDAPEEIGGDTPGPFKRGTGIETGIENPYVANIMTSRHGAAEVEMMKPASGDILAIRRVADLIDELHYLNEERSLGNTTVMGPKVWGNTLDRFARACLSLPCDATTQRRIYEEVLRHVREAFETGKVAVG